MRRTLLCQPSPPARDLQTTTRQRGRQHALVVVVALASPLSYIALGDLEIVLAKLHLSAS
jgi:hypothetical protein